MRLLQTMLTNSKIKFRGGLVLGGALMLIVLCGCSRKTHLKEQVSELEKAFPVVTTSEGAPAVADSVVSSAAEAGSYVQAAVAAVRTNDYAGGVMALQAAQRAKGISAQQLIVMERAKQAMVSELVNRATQGDARAKADLAAIEKTLSQ